MKKLIKIIEGKDDKYFIYEIGAGFFAEVRSKNRLKYFIELCKDYIGYSHKHPIFLNTYCYQHIGSVECSIKIIEKYKYEKN